MISRRTCLLAAAAGALALNSAEGFAPQPNVKSVTKLNNDIAPTGEFPVLVGAVEVKSISES